MRHDVSGAAAAAVVCGYIFVASWLGTLLPPFYCDTGASELEATRAGCLVCPNLGSCKDGLLESCATGTILSYRGSAVRCVKDPVVDVHAMECLSRMRGVLGIRAEKVRLR